MSDGVYVEYINKETGKKRRDTIETAVARSVRTGVAQATGDISLKRMEEMGWDLVLVSAHMGARTGDGGENPGNHAWWQGKIYSRSGKSKKFPPFSLTGYGTASENLIPMRNYQHRTKPTKANSTKRNSDSVLMSGESAKRRERFLGCRQESTMHRMKRQNSHYSKTLTGSLIFYRNKMLHIKIIANGMA